MSDKRTRYVIEVVGLDQLRQWSAEKATLEKRALAVERALLQTAAASERFDTAAKQSQLATARLNTEMARTAEIAERAAAADQRLALEQERLRQGAERLTLEQERLRLAGEKAAKTTETTASSMGALKQVAGGTVNVLSTLSAGIVGVGLASAQMAAKLERSFQNVRGNTTISATDFANMRAAVMKIGQDSGTAFDQLANGYMHVANFGFQAADATKVLSEANKAARATGAQTSDMAQTLAKVMAVYGISADRAAETTAKLWYAAANSDARMQELAKAGGQAFAMAHALGLSFDEAAAAASLFAAKGLSMSEAMTQLRGDISKMANPTKQVRQEVEYLSNKTGVQLTKDFGFAGGHIVSLSKMFTDLGTAAHIGGRPVAELADKLFPNLRGTIGALILAGGLPDLKARLEDLADPTKLISQLTARETSEQELLDTQIAKLTRTIEAEFLPIGTKFADLLKDAMPVVKGVADDVAKLLDLFLKLPKIVQDGVFAIGAFKLATMALGNPLTSLAGGLKWVISLFGGLKIAGIELIPALEGVAQAERDVAAAGAAGGAGGAAARVGLGAAARGLAGRALGGVTMLGGATTLLGAAALYGGYDLITRRARELDTDPSWMHPAGRGATYTLQTQAQIDAESVHDREIEKRLGIDHNAPTSLPTAGTKWTALDLAQWQRTHSGNANPGAASGGAGGSNTTNTAKPTNPLPDNWADLATAKPKKSKGGSGDDDDDKAIELNKTILSEIYGQRHTDVQTQRHDAVEKAHDWVTQDGANAHTAVYAHLWLTNALAKIQADDNKEKTNRVVDFIQDFQTRKQFPFQQTLGMRSEDPETRFNAFDSMARYDEERRNEVNDFNDQAAAQRKSAEQFKQQAIKDAWSLAANQAYLDNAGAIAMVAPAPGTGDIGEMMAMTQKRTQVSGYADQLRKLMAGGAAYDSELPKKLESAQAEVAKLTAEIKKLQEAIAGKTQQTQYELNPSSKATNDALGALFGPLTIGTGAVIPRLGGGSRSAHDVANAIGRGMQSGQASGAEIGHLFGRNGNILGGGIGGGIGGALGGLGATHLQTYFGDAAQAATIYSNGQQNGPVAGAIGGIATGAGIGTSLGGPLGGAIGAGVGGFLGLLGGIFGGHHRDPAADSKNHDPAFYNSPSDFDYMAYRFRATGKLPNVPGQSLNSQATTVNITIDGVKRSVANEVASQTSLGNVSQTNSYIDFTRPI
jgi:hypothetical protein